MERVKSAYAIGPFPIVSFRMSYYMQHKNGSWIEMGIPPISELGMKAIRESWEAYTMTKLATRADGQIIRFIRPERISFGGGQEF